ncbi:sigma factor-like helix-turn-helix DNA-binding protein [Nonomuraea aridisoli]|uniref:RNA polymerase sigma factor 70 region 4 type 2 domain-containing protein n=1 Tax=Nonomuraea aridisoli TaxID=2070368 RepID=A0A2W2FMS0_9ACTN|nr:sigma factor-like helix-turn-helix DNA-binding protein [Nonomuraea aridisoli]PZG16404.1 hypothetical protein C1J01_21125 [Nonomuraea aridisoli]
MILLERLTPPERAAFVLREAFGHSHREVAGILGVQEASARQLYRRARERLDGARPRFPADRDQAEGHGVRQERPAVRTDRRPLPG